tara:strand:+ start:8678 stop:9013 length:336 start_codon:yes stop_codon:yes gene_type:complete
MAKKLSERIRENIANKRPNKRAKNLSAFLANKEEIEAALEDKWSVKVIWETLHDEGRIGISYQAFNNYVNRHIKNKSADHHEHEKQKIDGNKPITSTGFVFNSTPKKEDLL